MRRLKIPKCFTCQYFVWWDGDYVCMESFKLLSPVHGVWRFNDEFIERIKKQQFCPSYEKSFNEFIKGMYVEEYLKWKELHDLEKQLERHVK